MEVLISIGVVAIGLLGVVQLLPLAYHQAFVGTQEDRKAVVGRAAFHSLRVREYHSLANWVHSNGSQVVPAADRMSFCLDPLFLAYNPGETSFPYDTARDATVRMDRITARMGLSGAPSPAAAEAAVVMQDDLEYEIPSDPLSPPLQVDANGFGRWNGGSAATKRQTGGRFSWLATFSPDLDGERDMYIVSVVVLFNRERLRLPGGIEPRHERAVGINFTGGGFGGGDCQLSTRGGPAEDLARIRAGDWIMVSGQVNASGNVNIHRWYRVVQAQGEIEGGGPFTRQVTLLGPDWSPGWPPPREAVILDGAVGVYSKTMRLETSSLWKAL